MDEMNTMNEVMDTENTNMVPTQDENLVMTEDNIEETSGDVPTTLIVSGAPAALIVGGVMLAGYVVGKLVEKPIGKLVSWGKTRVTGLTKRVKKNKGAEESKPVEVEVEATEVEPEEETK